MEKTGYTKEIEYTGNFYPDWSMSNLALQCLLKGIELPKIANACELGFGQGVTMNVMAASSDVKWYGTDFLVAHAQHAQMLADASGHNASIYNYSFEDFFKLENLPKFDLIVLHGVFSWISKKNQDLILSFIDTHLSEKGLLYISYNARPGSESFKPAQYLINKLHSQIGLSFSDPVAQIGHVLDFMLHFHEVSPKYLDAFPRINERLKEFKEKDAKYLIHEYLNSDWESFFFSEISEKLMPLGLSYLGESRLNSELPVLNFTDEQLDFLDTVKVDISMLQDLKDAMCNRQFRRDIWIKSPQALNPTTIEYCLQYFGVMLSIPYTVLNLDISGAQATASMDNPLYHKLLGLLKDYQVHELKELKEQLALTREQLLEMLGLLHAKGIIGLCVGNRSSSANSIIFKQCFLLNQQFVETAVKNYQDSLLVLPLVGLTFRVDYWASLYLYLYFKDKNIIKDPVSSIKSYLKHNNVQIYLDGFALEDTEKIHHFIQQVVDNMHSTSLLSFLKAHRIIIWPS